MSLFPRYVILQLCFRPQVERGILLYADRPGQLNSLHKPLLKPAVIDKRIRMSTNKLIHRLILHPADAQIDFKDFAAIGQLFTDIGLAGAGIAGHTPPWLMLGPNFFQWITFMGCAPALKLEPDDAMDEDFCHIRFTLCDEVQFRTLRPEVKGRCPACSKPGLTAEAFLREGHLQQASWTCPHCRQSCSPLALNWKNEAGLGRFFIEFMAVHPHEAVPVDSLLQRLAELSSIKWQYFYV